MFNVVRVDVLEEAGLGHPKEENGQTRDEAVSQGDVLPDLIIEITPVSTIPAIAATVPVPTPPSLPDTRQLFPLLGTSLRLM